MVLTKTMPAATVRAPRAARISVRLTPFPEFSVRTLGLIDCGPVAGRGATNNTGPSCRRERA
jgi:hypothetical protein